MLIDQPCMQQQNAVLKTMLSVARDLNDEKVDGGLVDIDQARGRAGL